MPLILWYTCSKLHQRGGARLRLEATDPSTTYSLRRRRVITEYLEDSDPATPEKMEAPAAPPVTVLSVEGMMCGHWCARRRARSRERRLFPPVAAPPLTPPGSARFFFWQQREGAF